MIGGSGLAEELRTAGIRVMTREQAPRVTCEADFEAITTKSFRFVEQNVTGHRDGKAEEGESAGDEGHTVQGVVAGFDFGVDYSAISYASLCLQLIPGSPFVATSRDSYDQLHDRRIPGTSCLQCPPPRGLKLIACGCVFL